MPFLECFPVMPPIMHDPDGERAAYLDSAVIIFDKVGEQAAGTTVPKAALVQKMFGQKKVATGVEGRRGDGDVYGLLESSSEEILDRAVH